MEKFRFILFGIVVLFFGFFSAFATGANISGPQEITTGELVTFEADVEGDWTIFPADKGAFVKDSGGKKLYFTAPDEGTFQLVYFGIEGGKPVIVSKQFTVKKNDKTPEPEPEPEPEPQPSRKLELTAEDKEACIFALESIIEAVDSKTVKTEAGARSYFKQYLLIKGGEDETLRPDIETLVDEWSERADYTSLTTLRKSFEEFLTEVRAATLKPSEKEPESWEGRSVEITTEKEFSTEVKEYEGLCFVQYGADYCGPCKKMKPLVEGLPIKTVYIDAEHSKLYPGGQIPRLEIYKDGKKVKTFIGYMSQSQLESKMEEYK